MTTASLISLWPPLLAAGIIVGSSSPTLAQATPTQATPTQATPTQATPAASPPTATPDTVAVTTNLLGLATLNPTLDVEAKVLGPLTLGATAWWEVRAVEDRWGELRATYYPWGTAMKGFGLAITGGVHRAYRAEDAAATVGNEATSPTAGVLALYNLRLGASEHFVGGLVAGVKTTFTDNDDASPLRRYYLQLRLNAGWVF